MCHHGPLLPLCFTERESDSRIRFFRILINLMSHSLIKIQDTKFRECVLKNLLINGNFEHFKHIRIAPVA